MPTHSQLLVLALAIAVVVACVVGLVALSPGSSSGPASCTPSATVSGPTMNETYCTKEVTVTSCADSSCPVPPPGFLFRGVLFQFELFPNGSGAGLRAWVTENDQPNQPSEFSMQANSSSPAGQQWNSPDNRVLVVWESPYFSTNPNGTISSVILTGVLLG